MSYEGQFDEAREAQNIIAEINEAPVSVENAVERTVKPKSKPASAKPKPTASSSTGILHVLLSKDGTYKEVAENDPQAAADCIKDPSLRLVRGQLMTPEISFKIAE